jgi:hypothetical protein
METGDRSSECHCRLHQPADYDSKTLDDGDRKLLADVLEYGWHLVLIPDDAVTRGWVFTVGMWHTLGVPELSLFGMDQNHAASALNLIGDAIRSGRPIGPDIQMDDILADGRLVTFRPVHPSWYGPMFGYATWFTRRPPLPIAQVFWSDNNGRWPWSSGAEQEYLVHQPKLWIPTDEHPQGSWSGTLAPIPWPFDDEPNTAVFTTRRIAFDGADVLGVAHDHDGSWQFLDGGSTSEDDIALVHMAHVVGKHVDVAKLADLPRGWQAWRSDTNAPWHRSPYHDES